MFKRARQTARTGGAMRPETGELGMSSPLSTVSTRVLLGYFTHRQRVSRLLLVFLNRNLVASEGEPLACRIHSHYFESEADGHL